MNNLPHKMPKKALFAFTICFLSFMIPITIGADPNYLYVECPNATLSTTSTYAANSTYQTNLNTLLSGLSSNSYNSSIGFYNFTAGSSPPDVAYGLFICRGDVSAAVCRDCVTYAVGDVVKRCPRSKRVTIWYDECILRYSNESIFSTSDTSFRLMLINPQNATNATSFREALGKVMNDVSARASSHDSGRKFATTELMNYSSLQPVYGLAQCTPDLSTTDCNTCLRTGIAIFPSCCDAKIGARVLFPSCYVHYETYPFYNSSVGAAPPPPSPALPPPPSTTTTSSPGKEGVSSKVIIAIVVPIGVSILLFVVGFCFVTRRAKKKYNFVKEADGEDDISAVQSLQYDFGTIQAATNNFSDDNKIGEGGFGPVYKGLLPDGQEVAVKRLSQSSGQGALEFKNEVLLVAKLQHRNLVRLLGFCLEGEEKILIYEFVTNKSLDYFLFDPREREKLDWSRRYKIIGGLARGMLYLHEDSRLRIIHRDLKASNILLDGDMNAKVSDFGTARIFGVDQSQGNTNRVVGTFGYMSPEYVMHGQFSVKSDVFSFGVLVLEIISGKKNNNFNQSDGSEDLLSHAWKLWKEGISLDLMDPTLEGSHSRNEVTRCIHIALLCVQDDPDARPSMATVVLMLNSYSATLSIPQEPAFFVQSKRGANTLQGLESDQSTSKSMPFSVNEASITELEPR
ncbi:cysteine-rich receptor-like protein kinase 10 isoform X1 [Rhododendron vialii]|uniref:cysteine-rich receptor-like protein kinase 10 isoform X1 n=1 Tax=Rhododendron vialii TaxID=182163 RepID=UPI0026600A91|nr:cysteine-rich receptor-like protein kinase 10 isoform X1 [Rhododendron vialii]